MKDMQESKDVIAEKFMLKDCGELHYVLSIKLMQKKDVNDIWIGYESY